MYSRAGITRLNGTGEAYTFDKVVTIEHDIALYAMFLEENDPSVSVPDTSITDTTDRVVVPPTGSDNTIIFITALAIIIAVNAAAIVLKKKERDDNNTPSDKH